MVQSLRYFLFIIILLSLTFLFVSSANAAEALQAYYYGPATANESAYGSVNLAQTFRVADPIELTKVRIPVSGSVTGLASIGIKATVNGVPYGATLAYKNLAGSTINANNTSWTEFELENSYSLVANSTYALIVRASTTDSTNPFYWEYDSSGAYANGERLISTNGGATWGNYSAQDHLFELYGDVDMDIVNVKIFSSFTETDDWLVVIHFENRAAPYYTQGYMAERSFRLQLLNASNNTIGESVIRGWGSRPGSIYLQANATAILDWRGDYRVRMTATGTTGGPQFYVSYELESGDWIGSDLELLDQWCLEAARLMGSYEAGDENLFLTEASGVGSVLNSPGASIFENGIPSLSNVRGDSLMEVYIKFIEEAEQDHPIDELYDYEVQLGPQIVDLADDLGDTFNLNERVILGLFLVMFGLGAMAMLPPTYASAGLVVFIWIVGGIGLASGVVQVAYIALAAFVIWVLMFRRFSRGLG